MEVTGISRSGRVRKKSSKLTDFQSPDEIDSARVMNKKMTPKTPTKQVNSPLIAIETAEIDVSLPPTICTSLKNLSSPAAINVRVESQLDINDAHAPQLLSLLTGQTISVDNQTFQISDVQEAEDDDDMLTIDTTVRKSAYMTEKSPKKRLRKDKGKSRFTAYIMWSKDVRQEMLKINPDMDFSAMSRRLGEMWANVPSNEKYNWRRRAKRMASKMARDAKMKPRKGAKVYDVGKETVVKSNKSSKSKFLNRNSTSSRKKTKKATAEGSVKRKVEKTHLSTANSSPTKSKSGASKSNTSPTITPGAYKVTGTAPIDVAAHLKLLGDSLYVIGQRLKEHEVSI